MPKYKVQVWIYCKKHQRLRVLLLKTRPGRGSFWQPVTGHVEKGESLKDAALREAIEETGLRYKSAVERLDISFRFESRWTGTCEEHGFALQVKPLKNGEFPELKLDPKEHTDYEWVSPTAALKKTKFSSNRKVLRALLKKIRK
jgi:8-oxo-dGTP pyrophosphatase MutT (NUDIX family)